MSVPCMNCSVNPAIPGWEFCSGCEEYLQRQAQQRENERAQEQEEEPTEA